MPSLIGRISRLARSERGRRLSERASQYANSPKGRGRVEAVRRQLTKRRQH